MLLKEAARNLRASRVTAWPRASGHPTLASHFLLHEVWNFKAVPHSLLTSPFLDLSQPQGPEMGAHETQSTLQPALP